MCGDKLIGFLNLLKKDDFIIGYKMLKIGVFLEVDAGVIQFLFGFLMIWKKRFALALLKN